MNQNNPDYRAGYDGYRYQGGDIGAFRAGQTQKSADEFAKKIISNSNNSLNQSKTSSTGENDIGAIISTVIVIALAAPWLLPTVGIYYLLEGGLYPLSENLITWSITGVALLFNILAATIVFKLVPAFIMSIIGGVQASLYIWTAVQWYGTDKVSQINGLWALGAGVLALCIVLNASYLFYRFSSSLDRK